MPNVDRLSLFSRSSSNIGVGLQNMGMTDKINFDLYPDNAATMIDEGLVFKVLIDDVRALSPGFSFPGLVYKAILFAPRVAGILTGFSLFYGGSFFKQPTTGVVGTAIQTTPAGFFDLSALDGIQLPVPTGKTVPGWSARVLRFVDEITFNYNGSVSLKVNWNSNPETVQGNDKVWFSLSYCGLQGSFYVERAATISSWSPLGAYVPLDQIDPAFKNTLPDSWFV